MLFARPITLALFVLAASGATAGRAAAGDPPSCLVAGVVEDPTGQPIAGARVVLSPGGERTVADGEGRYCFERAAGPVRQVSASHDGFVTARRDLPSSPPFRADFVLGIAGFNEETVVTATGTRQGLDEVPIRTEVVGRRAIEDIGARSLADAMEFTTGVRVESNCQNCNFAQIRLLGLDGPYTQILFDGQPLLSSLAAVYGVEQIPARLVQRIEVVKGGGSALYGAGSVGGVVNVIPREPSRPGAAVELRTEVSRGVPSYQGNTALDWTTADRQAMVTGFAQIDRVKPLDTTGDGFTEIAQRRLDAFGVRGTRYLLGSRAKLAADVTRFDEDRRGGNLLRLAPDRADIAEAIDTRRTSGSLAWFHGVSPAWDYRITASVADTSRDSYYGARQDPDAYGVSANTLWLGQVQVNRYFSRHALTAGTQVTREVLTDEQRAYGRSIDERYRNVGVFVQDDVRLARTAQLLVGSRFDRSSVLDKVTVSPRVALRYSPAPSLDARVSLARGFRPPQVFDEDLHISSAGGQAVIIRRSDDLREERSTNYMAGFEWKPEAGPGQALLEVNAFRTDLDDLFYNIAHPAPVSQQFEYLKVNLGSARVHGVEMNLGWGTLGDEDGILIQGGMVVQRARLGAPEPDFGSRDFFRTPRTYGNLTATYARRNTRLFVGGRYTGRMSVPHRAGSIPSQRLETSPRFFTLDASVAQTWRVNGGPRVVLTVGGRNVTNAYQEDFDQGIDRDSDYIYGPRFPRSLYTALKVEY